MQQKTKFAIKLPLCPIKKRCNSCKSCKSKRNLAFPNGEPVTGQGRWGPLAVDESLVAFPFGEPVTGQGRWGPLAVDESLVAFPFGEGGPLAVDEGCFGILYPHPGYPEQNPAL